MSDYDQEAACSTCKWSDLEGDEGACACCTNSPIDAGCDVTTSHWESKEVTKQ